MIIIDAMIEMRRVHGSLKKAIIRLLTVILLAGMLACVPEQTASAPTVTAHNLLISTATLEPKSKVTDIPPTITAEAISPSVTREASVNIAPAIEDLIKKSGGDWHILIMEAGGQVIYARGDHTRIHPASVIKVPIAMLFFTALAQEAQPEDLPGYLEDRGTDGRSYDQLLRAMLVKSEEPAAQILLDWTGDRLRVDEVLSEWGLMDTQLEPRRTTLADLARIFIGLYNGKWISTDARDYILERLAEYTPNDDLRLGGIRSCQSEGEKFFNKRGTLTDDLLIVADSAIVQHGEKVYFVGVFAYQSRESDSATTYERLEAGMADFSTQLCRYFGAN